MPRRPTRGRVPATLTSRRRARVVAAARAEGATVHDGGTCVVMEGPAFSTRAESELYRSWGASVIGMTALPEAKLAREAEIAYAMLALSTDYDCWHVSEAEVSVADVIAVLHRNVALSRRIIRALALAGHRRRRRAAGPGAVAADLAAGPRQLSAVELPHVLHRAPRPPHVGRARPRGVRQRPAHDRPAAAGRLEQRHARGHDRRSRRTEPRQRAAAVRGDRRPRRPRRWPASAAS